MSTISSKVKKFHGIRVEFGWWMWILKMLSIIYPYAKHKNKIAEMIFHAKNKKIISTLETEYGDLAKKWALAESSKEAGSTIWTFWWQGTDRAPEPVKNCIHNMEKYADGKRVIVITKDNIKEYINLPQIIYDKVENGSITFTHLSDVVRVNLLYKYGGLWLDGGIFPVRLVDELIFNAYYWSRKVKKYGEAHISGSRWCVSLFSARSGGGYCGYMVSAFNLYWSKHDVLLDYFLIDYLTEVAYRNIGEFREAVDHLPVSSPDLYEVEKCLNMPVEEYGYFGRVITENLFIRLKWRNRYNTEDNEGRRTVYGEFFAEEVLK